MGFFDERYEEKSRIERERLKRKALRESVKTALKDVARDSWLEVKASLVAAGRFLKRAWIVLAVSAIVVAKWVTFDHKALHFHNENGTFIAEGFLHVTSLVFGVSVERRESYFYRYGVSIDIHFGPLSVTLGWVKAKAPVHPYTELVSE